jgi:NAD(P)-dependent dehydrogenase (short-subunit alcohol dehydrogenase family)
MGETDVTYANYPSLKDKTVFISGGASGIGESIVRHFVEQGAKVGFIDIVDEAAKALIADIGSKAKIHYEHCDVTDIAALKGAIDKVRKALGPITILVNNAAHDQRHKIDDVTPEFWDNRIAVNVRHQFFAAQAIYPDMKAAGGGAIINYSSSAWLTGAVELAAYSTAKAGVLGLTKSLARDLGPYNIRVNAIIPGWIMTQRQLDLWLTPEAEKNLMARQCLKHKLQPADCARMTLFLASDDASGLTSQSFVVDGGRL